MKNPRQDPRHPLRQLAAFIRQETGAKEFGIASAADFMMVAMLVRELGKRYPNREAFVSAFKDRTKWTKNDISFRRNSQQ